MIVTRTPYRISLFGGGTDFPLWYKQNEGFVLSFTIDKYCFLSVRKLPEYLDYRFRISYSIVETPQTIDEIKHPAVREALRIYSPHSSLEISYGGDLPARSGVGSSSAFAVGLIHALKKLNRDIEISKKDLAYEAIRLEQDVLRENVGTQDQIACSYGGVNFLRFGGSTEPWSVETLSLDKKTLLQLENRMVLLYTGISRLSSDISGGLIENISRKNKELERTSELALSCREILLNNGDISAIGEMLNESWKIKKEINPYAVTPELTKIYNMAIAKGAIGGKVLGAGGGGFLLFWLSEGSKEYFLRSFDVGTVVPFQIEFLGSTCLVD